jgi:hypothetical protein
VQRGGTSPSSEVFQTRQVLMICSGNEVLKFAKGGRKNAGQGVGAPAGEEKTKGEQEFRKGVLHTIVGKVEAVGKMDKEDRASHHDHDAESADADEDAGEHCESACKLRQTNQESYDPREMSKGHKTLEARPPKGAEENGAAVVQKDECTGDAEDEQSDMVFPGDVRGQRCWRGHKTILSKPRICGECNKGVRK